MKPRRANSEEATRERTCLPPSLVRFCFFLLGTVVAGFVLLTAAPAGADVAATPAQSVTSSCDGHNGPGVRNPWVFDEFPAGWTLDFTGGLPAAPCSPPPANDDFANAAVLTGTSGATTGATLLATGETAEPDHAGVSAPLGSVWYEFTPTLSDVYSFDTCSDADYDTVLAAYTGTSVGTLSAVAANNDASGCGDGTQSRIAIYGLAGTAYQIAVDGVLDSAGTFTLSYSARSRRIRIRPTYK